MVLKCSLLQLINKYTLVVFMQVFRTRVSFSDIGTMLKFGTLNCIILFYNSISGQFNPFLYYATFSVSRSSFSWLVLFHTSPKILRNESGYVDLKKVVDFVFNFSFSLFLFILIFFSKLRRIMPCLYCVINCDLKLFSLLPAPILTCVVLGRVSVYF